MTFREKVKQVRKQLFLSQEAMAKELRVSVATVNRWETAKTYPNYKAQRTFAGFCKSHGIKADWEV